MAQALMGQGLPGQARGGTVAGAAPAAGTAPAAGSKFCIECGKPIADRAKFCPECGKPQ
jgi:membrane protease subunit (stomatin/prohibitin family)